MDLIQPGHYVAIVGSAVAGSEAAEKLSQRNIRCAVFEQNELPYGKIETGLPKWHIKLRDSQEQKIDSKLEHPLVDFVPRLRMGKDFSFEDLTQKWGFSAVLLATGAWRDRPLGVPGIEAFVDQGFYYQNPFVAWFNQNHDPAYDGPEKQIEDGAIIIGGGLASFDVAKIVMIELVQKALEKRGVKSNIFEIEKSGIPAVLDRAGLGFEDLKMKGCTLCYRRSITDMPLTSLPENPSDRDVETAQRVRRRIFDNMQSKYLFHFRENTIPAQVLTENGSLHGLVFHKTEIFDGRLRIIDHSDHDVQAPLVISAIGSLPEKINGIPMKGDVYDIDNELTGRLNGFTHVFALGNAVTGRGNIKESQMHGRQVSQKVMDEYLAWREEDYHEIFQRAEQNADRKVEAIGEQLKYKKMLSASEIEKLRMHIRQLQKQSGYNGDYKNWIQSHLPERLEKMIQFQD